MTKTRLKIGLAVLVMLFSLLAGTSIVSAAAPTYTCTSGTISPGTYQSLTIAGNCTIPSGTVTVLGAVIIMPSASLNAAGLGYTSTVKIGGNVNVGYNGILVLGCETDHWVCAATTNDSVGGNIYANTALALIVHHVTINGNVSVTGGGQLSALPNPALSAVLGFPIPVFSAYEDNNIGGNLSVNGYRAFWLGFHRNQIAGNLTVDNNQTIDPDLIEVASNTINGSLACYGNIPGVSDETEGSFLANTVSGRKLGQCTSL